MAGPVLKFTSFAVMLPVPRMAGCSGVGDGTGVAVGAGVGAGVDPSSGTKST